MTFTVHKKDDCDNFSVGNQKVAIVRVQICNSENCECAISSIVLAIIILQLLVIKDLYLCLSYVIYNRDFYLYLKYFIQQCSICRPSDSIVSEGAGNEPQTVWIVVTLALVY
jgi:hypothetical protein